jgi:tryptophan 2,3-dioxygenase
MHAGGAADPKPYGDGDLTYNDYLMVPQLLGLQVPQTSPSHHDEMLFIVIHQAYELWFKLILHEMEHSIGYMEKGEILRAHHFINRSVQIMKLLVQQIHILETMTPVEFLEFRDRLNPASGFQSSQFREIEFIAGLKDRRFLKYFHNKPEFLKTLERRLAAPDLRTAYYDLLRAQGFKIPANASEVEGDSADEEARSKMVDQVIQGLKVIYQKPSDHLPLYLLSEGLVEFDQYLGLWREHHVRVVERVIGFKRGTGGSSGVAYLQSTTNKKCFPALWEVRTHLEKNGNP